jgi:hypothetical protein
MKLTSLVATMVRHVERKAISPGTKNLLHSLHLFSVVSLHGILVAPPIKINACPIWATVAPCVGGIPFRFQIRKIGADSHSLSHNIPSIFGQQFHYYDHPGV